MQRGHVFLMYHELGMPGRKPFLEEPGYTRYVVRESDFRQQLQMMKESGMRGLSVGEALAGTASQEPGVVITFDDGCETDFLAAAPALQSLNFSATFYVVSDFVGQPGILSPSQLRALSEMGFEVGSHSKTHAYLPDLHPDRLRNEISNSKDRLEQILGRRVEHFSCPGGRWNRVIAEMCREAGYRSVVTSRIGRNSPTTDRFCLRRVVVQRNTAAHTVLALAGGQGLGLLQLRQALLDAAKGLMGNPIYEKLRSVMLHSE
ncbi:MAG TPA: polysaccharide deacetylase family protein [Candidatus Angelobacter sp.]|nr:polysaccharide deacetylase family protein [Candidatus Angelobacter sp.]